MQKTLLAAVAVVLLAVVLWSRPVVQAAQVTPQAGVQRWEYGRLMIYGVYSSFVTSSGTLDAAALAKHKSQTNPEATPTEVFESLGNAGWEYVDSIKPFTYDKVKFQAIENEPDVEYLFRRAAK